MPMAATRQPRYKMGPSQRPPYMAEATAPSLIPVAIEDEMRQAYLDYSMSVIVGRALPDVRDGLKPVHRRILYAMFEQGMLHNRRYSKCAGTVGEVLKRYHPHGDAAVYDALVRLAQEWNLRAPLIDGQGNFGSIDGDSAAAYRYTEARLTRLAETGRGILKLRAKVEVETDKKSGRDTIVVAEVPYQVNKARAIQSIAELVKDKKLEGISDLRDESSREGIRAVVETKRDAVTGVVLNNLYQHSALFQDSFGATMLAIDRGQPRTLGLKPLLERFIAHRRDVVTRRTRYDLRKAREREHILLGYKIALDHIDEIIAVIKASPNRETASNQLQSLYQLSEIQAKAILEMQLQRLTGLEKQKIVDELAEVQKLITQLSAILGSEQLLLDVIKTELREVQRDFSDPRRTEIVGEASDLSTEDLIADEDMVVTVSHAGYVKRNPVSLYRAQKRGGKGKTGAASVEDDFIEQIFVASTHAYLLLFTNKGRVFWLKVHELPQAGRAARGKAIVNLVQLAPEEKIAALLTVKELPRKGLVEADDTETPAEGVAPVAPAEDAESGGEVETPLTPEEQARKAADDAIQIGKGPYILFVTRNGLVKRTALHAFSRPRPSGLKALSIEENDSLVSVMVARGDEDVVIGTRTGMAIRFEQKEVRSMGRTAYGVKGITLEANDQVVGAELLRSGSSLLTITENGYGKRTAIDEYRR